MHGTYIGNGKMLVNLAYNGMLTISSEDQSIMPILVTTGMFEVPLTKYFMKNVKAGDTVVDIGTNVGYFTLLAAKLVGVQGCVIGYEANPQMYTFVQNNIAMNWVTDQVKLFNKAVYSKKTEITFQLSENFHAYSSISDRPVIDNVNDSFTSISVPAVDLDSELGSMDKIDLLKIDIEGGEYQALLGMMDLIKQKKIKRISFEWNKPMLGEEAEPFKLLLSEMLNLHGGRLYFLNEDGDALPTTIKEITSLEFYPFALLHFN